MDSQNLPCPRCPQICHSTGELISHLRSRHRLTEDEIHTLRGRGYFEDKVPTPTGDVALEHRKAAVRAQASNALNIPFVLPPERKRQANLLAGWQKTLEGFVYEKLVSQTQSIDTIIKKIIKGSLISNHGGLSLYTYTKDTDKLSKLQDKERTLEAKLTGYVTADPEFSEIAQKLYETKEQIREIKKDTDVDVEKEMLLEDWYSGDLDGDDYVEWSEKFMEKSLLEAEQVMKQYTSKQEIKL